MTDIKNNENTIESLDKLTVNAMPSKTWYWLGVNDASLTWKTSDENIIADDDINVEKGQKHEDVFVEYTSVYKEFNQKKVNISAEEDGEITVIVPYNEQNNIRTFININVGKNAKVKLIQIQSVEQNTLYNEIKASCEESGYFELIQAFAGKGNISSAIKYGDIYSDVKVDLVGDRADFKYDVGYLGQGGNELDFNIVVNHMGKNTNCDIKASGALKESALKVFRGTIDFKTGSSGSVGAETETVLMLGDEVVNKTVPVILCSEEDVSGTHGATIGELDDETLFYFESRGIDKTAAENILARASIERLNTLIENDSAKEIIENVLKEALGDD
ncbi:MAG: SufD family Fe-S cluster assembly protein [Lachnospiraceae bacterium]|nr:SufD family Fe-S cluster assembly protein [Lachnospiraceae bacterium]